MNILRVSLIFRNRRNSCLGKRNFDQDYVFRTDSRTYDALIICFFLDVTQNFDCVFWCGDLNFRLAQAREDVIHWVEEYKFPLQVDLKTDQLTRLITEGNI